MNTNEPTRSVENLSLLWPLLAGDIIELETDTGGNLWRVDRSSSGWFLHNPNDITQKHPGIHGIDGMADFIGAIIEWAKGYS